MFAYCENNPVNMGDPTGCCSGVTIIITAYNPTIGYYTITETYCPCEGSRPVGFFGDYSDSDVNILTKVKNKPNMVPRKDKRHGSENRTKSGLRERNVAHPNGEEHSRVPKGNSPKRIEAGIGLVTATIVIVALVADVFSGVGTANDVALIPATSIWWDYALATFS